MAEHERVHLSAFRTLVPEFRARPSALLPLWGAAGWALGFASALAGRETAYAVTVAVETAITEHYDDQVGRTVGRRDVGTWACMIDTACVCVYASVVLCTVQ